MQPNRTVVAMLLPLALLACNAMPSRLAGTSADLSADPAAAVAKMMQGHYDSRDQAAADKTYFPIALAMVPIWPERSDGYWLYVEQAMADSPDKPYRQRVYRVYNGERGEVISEVFTFAGPERFVQGWRTGTLAGLYRDGLQPRVGCAAAMGSGKARPAATAAPPNAAARRMPLRRCAWNRGGWPAGTAVSMRPASRSGARPPVRTCS